MIFRTPNESQRALEITKIRFQNEQPRVKPFLRLPPELQLNRWEYALPSSGQLREFVCVKIIKVEFVNVKSDNEDVMLQSTDLDFCLGENGERLLRKCPDVLVVRASGSWGLVYCRGKSTLMLSNITCPQDRKVACASRTRLCMLRTSIH